MQSEKLTERYYSYTLQPYCYSPPIDDSILFSEIFKEEAIKIKHILHEYTEVSGQSINLGKSAIVFSPNTLSDLKLHIASILQVGAIDTQDQFLGLPSYISRSEKPDF